MINTVQRAFVEGVEVLEIVRVWHLSGTDPPGSGWDGLAATSRDRQAMKVQERALWKRCCSTSCILWVATVTCRCETTMTCLGDVH